MRRRKLLATVPITLLAGCSGYKVQRERVDEAQRTEIAQLDDRVDELESELNRSQSRTNELERQVTELESERDRLLNDNRVLESDIADLDAELLEVKMEHIVSLYDEAVQAKRFGNGAMSNGRDNFESGSYEIATNQLGQAYADYGLSEDLFERSEEYRREYSLDADGIISESADKATILKDAAFNLSLAAYFYSIGDESTGQDYIDEFNDINDDFDRYVIEDVETLQSILS